MAVSSDVKLKTFKQLRTINGRAAVEARADQATMVAGDFNIVSVHEEMGVLLAGEQVNMMVLPNSVRVAGVLSLNPMAFIPGAPTFSFSPPMQGPKNLAAFITAFASMIAEAATAAAL